MPVFALLAAILFKIVPCFNRIINNIQIIRFNKPSFDIIFKEYFIARKEIQSDINFIEFQNLIEFKDVSFSYSSKKISILKNINFKISKGESIAIIGPNGAGKSTLLNLLSGLILPTQGKILVDNVHNISKIHKSWLNNISYVQQNIFLLNDSIKKNIIFENDNMFDAKKYNKILNLLNLEDSFKNFPMKLDTIVSNDEGNLSGGQKQIISIARALYKNSHIIIFDEANSALDINYLKVLKDLLKKLNKSKTIILVTHELLLLENNFDKIYKIEKGNLMLFK
jgi:ABC-type bacteriocin/lantibiotic exporter with double-glycine peptidase domain